MSAIDKDIVAQVSATQTPIQPSLYDPRNEHDACGNAFVANKHGKRTHDVIERALQVLVNLDHRGAVGADPTMGDGAGCLIQTPDKLLRNWATPKGLILPPKGQYAAVMAFLPQDDKARAIAVEDFEEVVKASGQTLLAWRVVPTNPAALSDSVRATMPEIRQAIITADPELKGDQDAFERALFTIGRTWQSNISLLAQKLLESKILNDAQADQLRSQSYLPSCSSRTVVYKGLLLAPVPGKFYLDLSNPDTESAFAIVHQRFSTNTFPSWKLAHPYRFLAHNGEINTVRGNVNWMNARRQSIESPFGDDLNTALKTGQLINPAQSDTASLDDAFGLLTVAGGYTAYHAMAMLIPEAWQKNKNMDPKLRAFYEYYAAFMEPWDGPASIAFTDGRYIGATLDRNGLRPARYTETNDLVVMASEVGVLPDIPEAEIVHKGRLEPGKMLVIDTDPNSPGIIPDDEIKRRLADEHPYGKWLAATQHRLAEFPAVPPTLHNEPQPPLRDQQNVFGYTDETVQKFLQPMALTADDAISSMGTDTPPAVLAEEARPLYHYFKQVFAQVTNPPIDSIRELNGMSLLTILGPRPNLLGGNTADRHFRLELDQPILTNADLDKIKAIKDHDKAGHAFSTATIDATWSKADGPESLTTSVDRLCQQAEDAVKAGNNIVIISDRNISKERAPIPSLLATAAVHHHLIRAGLRTNASLVVETGDAAEVHDFSALAGYGAEAINPYVAYATVAQIHAEKNLEEQFGLTAQQAQKNYIYAIGKNLLKVMSKMGISTFQSYCGAQLFDALGLSRTFAENRFPGTPSGVDGIGETEVGQEVLMRHGYAFDYDANNPTHMLAPGGIYAKRVGGATHAWEMDSVGTLRHTVVGLRLPEGENITKSDLPAAIERAVTDPVAKAGFQRYSEQINTRNRGALTLRGLMQFVYDRPAVPLEEVESVISIVKRFATGAMSYGSISLEAHTTLAKAMNTIGGKSNTGEGGEESDRFKPNADGSPNPMRSAIKQVASGRFGVTAEYLVNADDIQIKMAQGAKPGEGGQLPGKKVSGPIGRVRYSTPGVGLISPPPHHDIYSIEDLAQLIYDLKNVNPKARISVKLVSEIGVGTIAAGVTKARADHVTIAGYEGGTGASPLTSLTHAGSPWEIGLAETQQTLVLNGLRGRIAVQVDGGLRTARDVVIGALLGADEFGFSTMPLVASGCIMMRKCHDDSCPVGIASQNPELRKLFPGLPEDVMNAFFLLAEGVREQMAKLGYRTFNEMVGQSGRLEMKKSDPNARAHWKSKGVDFDRLLYQPPAKDKPIYNCEPQKHHLEKAMDNQLIALAQPAILRGEHVDKLLKIRNTNRTLGAMLSGEIAQRYGHEGLPEDTITFRPSGTAGGSFGAFLARGVTLDLTGDANDYVGKGLSGGKIIIRQPPEARRKAAKNIIVGNTVLYGAIAGEAYFNGVAGERFAVRNSGAIAVAEAVGDHGCEYMTGGVVVVLGETGRNFAAGMSGGVAYVYNPSGRFEGLCNEQLTKAILPVTMPMAEADLAANQEFAPRPRSISVHDAGMGDLLRFDAERLHMLVQRQADLTDSELARELLADWNNALPNFVKVMAPEFRDALEQQKTQREKAPALVAA